MASLWSPRRLPSNDYETVMLEDTPRTPVRGGERERLRTRYVSKESQLEKLRARMLAEERVPGRKNRVDWASEQCGKCDSGLISL
jgi:hypothetical protein